MTASERERIAHRALDTDETLLWVGSPDSGVLDRSTLGFFAFGLVWTTIYAAVRWINWSSQAVMFDNRSLEEKHVLLFFDIVFGVVGGGFMLSPIIAYLRARLSIYAVTERRLVIVECWKLRKIRSYTPSAINALDVTVVENGVGNLVFARTTYPNEDGDLRIWEEKLEGVLDVAVVQQLIRTSLLPAIISDESQSEKKS